MFMETLIFCYIKNKVKQQINTSRGLTLQPCIAVMDITREKNQVKLDKNKIGLKCNYEVMIPTESQIMQNKIDRDHSNLLAAFFF